MPEKPLALVVGVGPTTGTRVCRLLAERYTLALVARSAERIDALAAELADAHAYPCDVGDRKRWGDTLLRIRAERGVPSRILVNTESAQWGAYHALSLAQFAASFDVNAVSLL